MKKFVIFMFSFVIGIIFLTIFLLSGHKVYFELKGSEIVELNIGEKFNDSGYVALECKKHMKIFCKNLKNNVNISTYRKSATKEFKNYVLNYKNTEKILKREIIYKDMESPTIELVDNGMTQCPNKEYVEEGFKAYDNVDGDITDRVNVSVNKDKVTYTVYDKAGNKRVIFRDIKYNDTEAPKINLDGGEKSYIFINQEYNEMGYNAQDNCDGDITNKVTIKNNVNINKAGDYTIEYSVSDAFNNKTTVSRKVIVYDDLSKVPKNGKVVYLTFDDGPCSYTNKILDVLNKYNVKATFFVTNQFSSYQDVIKKEYDNGHTVAIHTYSHRYEDIYSSLDSYLNDFNAMNNVIFEQTGTYTKIFRFPGGSSNTISNFTPGIVTQVANKMTELGYSYFDWNIDSTDTSTNDAEKIYQTVISEIANKDNSVVLMHDIKKANIESVDKIINYGLSNGYTFLPITENTPAVHHHINN